MQSSKDITDCDWFSCAKCHHVWYVLNQRSPHDESFIPFEANHTLKCLRCHDTGIKKIDIMKACCSWVDDEVNCKAIFGREGYYRDSKILQCIPIAWHSYLEKEIINFDGTFKAIISYLINANSDRDFGLKPDLYVEKDGSKVYYPIFQQVAKTVIPKANTLKVVDFLRYEGALKEDGVSFTFCPSCGTTNRLSFRMEERECAACGYRDNPECDQNCPEYDTEVGQCSTINFPKICCFILPSGDCLGPKSLEVECQNCGNAYADSAVCFDPPEKKEIEAIVRPWDCDSLAIRYKPVPEVLKKLDEGFTFQEMIIQAVKVQGWNTTSGRKPGRSGVRQDIDILCEKGTKSVLVECKRLVSTKGIDLNVVMTLFARMNDLGISKGLIVTTTQRASPEALSYARYYGIEILNVQKMLSDKLESILWK